MSVLLEIIIYYQFLPRFWRNCITKFGVQHVLSSYFGEPNISRRCQVNHWQCCDEKRSGCREWKTQQDGDQHGQLPFAHSLPLSVSAIYHPKLGGFRVSRGLFSWTKRCTYEWSIRCLNAVGVTWPHIVDAYIKGSSRAGHNQINNL